MRLVMGERRVLVKAFAQQYQAGGRKERSATLNEFVAMSGYARAYASWLLRWHGRRVQLGDRLVVVGDATKRLKRQRQRVYGPRVVAVLRRLWVLLDYASGKRLAPALGRLVDALERHGELVLEPEVRAKLLAISPATIDRILACEKQRYALRSRARTKPGTLLRHQIPIRTFSEWDDARPGFVEIDLVGHDGGWDRGDFCHTLTVTDVATTWTELGTARNKAQVWVFGALQGATQRMPFPLLGIHSDNGGEFINNHLVTYCHGHGIDFTRSRSYRKNDNCFVEQKNWSVVRRFIGYARYDTDAACLLLQQLDVVLSDYLNFFVPSAKLVAKVREGAKVHKRHDRAQTPFERVLASPEIAEETKQALRERAAALNPAALMRTIRKLQRKLDSLATATSQAPPDQAMDRAAPAESCHPPCQPHLPAVAWKTPAGFPTRPTASTTTKETPDALT
jgi:hypothetical protein